MKLKNATIELLIDDLPKSQAFYENELDFKTIVREPEINPFFIILQHDQIQVMLYTRQEFEKEIPQFKTQPTSGTLGPETK